MHSISCQPIRPNGSFPLDPEQWQSPPFDRVEYHLACEGIREPSHKSLCGMRPYDVQLDMKVLAPYVNISEADVLEEGGGTHRRDDCHEGRRCDVVPVVGRRRRTKTTTTRTKATTALERIATMGSLRARATTTMDEMRRRRWRTPTRRALRPDADARRSRWRSRMRRRTAGNGL